jgi:hypothetical protein
MNSVSLEDLRRNTKHMSRSEQEQKQSQYGESIMCKGKWQKMMVE